MSKFKVYRNLYELYKKQQNKRMIAFYILIALFLSTLIIFATDLPFEVGIVTMMMINIDQQVLVTDRKRG